jgi:predicted amidohydrolase
MPSLIRAAAAQFGVGTDVEENLATCLRMIDRAAGVGPDLVVLPEFCNRLSWYSDKGEAYHAAIGLDGEFIGSIQEKVRQHGIALTLNCTVKRPNDRITITSFLIGPDGSVLLSADKQTLMGRENLYFDRAEQASGIVSTDLGRIGLFMCRDGVTMETPRMLAIQGAQILCNSLNSFAFDEASLHIPVRAPENKVFIVAANKVGPLIPLSELEAAAKFLGVEPVFLYGAGESQIVAPDGRVLAKGPRREEAIVFADIDPSAADSKLTTDGTDIMQARRPDQYRHLIEMPPTADDHSRAPELRAAVWSSSEPIQNVAALTDIVAQAAAQDVALLVVPELSGIPDGGDQAAESVLYASDRIIESVRRALRNSELGLVTSLAIQADEGLQHAGVYIDKSGMKLAQPQIHASSRTGWSQPGDGWQTLDLPWGRLGILTGQDSIFPESARILASLGADVLAVPFEAHEAWELELGLVDRSAENRVCLIAATRTKPIGTSIIVDQWRDFQLFTPWEGRQFDGTINDPIVHRAPQSPGLFIQSISPETARFKVMSYETDLVQGRPWWLLNRLAE